MAAILALSIAVGLAPQTSASSHREAPMIADDPTADVTDVYAFVSPDSPDTVTIIANWIPFEDPAGGPNFYKFSANALYEIQIDNDGDARADITYSFRFRNHIRNPNTFLYNTGPITSLSDPDYNQFQTYEIGRHRRQTGGGPVRVRFETLATNLIVPPVNIGPASTPDYEALASMAIYSLPGNRKVFVGQRDDPFFVDLGAIFDLLTIRPGPPGNMGGGRDDLSGFNVHTIALQVPITDLTRDGQMPVKYDDPNAVIGIWAQTSRPNVTVIDQRFDTPPAQPRFVQVSRLGNPLVNEVLIPLAKKDEFNHMEPYGDPEFEPYILNPEPAVLLNALYGLSVPTTNRTDLKAVLLTGVPKGLIPGFATFTGPRSADMLRLNLAIPPSGSPQRLGVLGGDLDGFPNGRRLTDDVVDIELQAVAGAVLAALDPSVPPPPPLGDGVNQNDVPFLPTFPYVATPHQGFEHSHHRMEPPTAAQ
ncbi:MAG TPA: hypothetical protein DEP84_08900 [Chloroflexi bacterium]|nr:hypothetical protein [Chloroflexota bacterium]